MVFFMTQTPIEKIEVRRAALRRNRGELANTAALRAMLSESSSCGRGCFRREGHCTTANHFMRNGHQVALPDVFLLIRKSSHPAVDFR
jgi:hypothetical protein